MKIRCDLHVNGGSRKPYFVAAPNEPDSHLAHKLAAYVLFWDEAPILDAGPKNPALAGFEFLPDLLAVDEGGSARLWVECGTATLHKLTKITRRAPRCRIVVMKETLREGERFRADLAEQFDRPGRVEVLAWPGDSFRDWSRAVSDKTEVYGEASGHMINAVMNGLPFVVEFASL